MARLWNFLLLVIIKRITLLSRFKLYFHSYASLIFWLLYNTNKVLTAIELLFDWNFFPYFLCEKKSIPFQLYWSIKEIILDILYGSLAIFLLIQLLQHIENIIIIFWIYCCSLIFNHLGESIYDPPRVKPILWHL